MAFKTKTDYYGISGDKIKLISTTENKSAQTVTAKGEDGYIVADQVFGIKSAPACDYVVVGNTALSSIVLGAVTTQDSKRFCLTNVSITTGAGQPPTVAASGEQVEDTDAGVSNKTTLPAVTLAGTHHAQDFGAFTVSGAGAHLTQSTLDATATLTTAAKDGDTLAHDISEVMMTVNGTIQVSDSAYGVPTLSPSTGWEFTSPLTETNPDSDFPTYTFSMTKYLSADAT